MPFKFLYVWHDNTLLSFPWTSTDAFSFLYLSASQRPLEGSQTQNIRIWRTRNKIKTYPPPIELLLEKGDEVGNVWQWVIFFLSDSNKYIHKTHEAGNSMLVSFILIGLWTLLIILSHLSWSKNVKIKQKS